MIRKSVARVLVILGFFLFFYNLVYAKEITVLYTGSTHASLYPCHCPIEPDGGLARRATLIKQLREKYPQVLVLDSGNIFSSGLLDEYTQNTQLDIKRTQINLRAMELIKYDAVAIGDNEFNFGKDFLLENIAKTKFTFLSANLETDKIPPYIIKEADGVKIGIIGVTKLFSLQKAEGLKIGEPKAKVAKVVAQLKGKAVNLIILLSNLTDEDNANLLDEVKGIDIVIAGYGNKKNDSSVKIGEALVLYPAWQGRRLGKLTLEIKEGKIANSKVEELRLSEKVKDDPGILKILPRCFTDNDCRKGNLTGICQNPGSPDAKCFIDKPNKVNLLVISSRECRLCQDEEVVNLLKKEFPGLSVAYRYYPDKKAVNLVKDLNVQGLPVYLLGKEIEKEKNFSLLKSKLELKGDYYLLKPEFSGLAYFQDREKLKGNLDLFISLYDKNSAQLLEMVKEFNPKIHFLAFEKQNSFDAPFGPTEVEEDLRSLCVQRYHPDKFWDYASCRAKNINSSWWEDCVLGLDLAKIKACAKGEEGKTLLRENISLTKELQIMFGPVCLLNNQEIFGLKGVPKKEEFKKVIER